MPLADFVCPACAHAFEDNVPVGTAAKCPQCQTPAERQFTIGRQLKYDGPLHYSGPKPRRK